jgi:hypothetical protein
MWFCPRQKPDTDCVDPGDSTDIIHKRILKGTRPWRAAGFRFSRPGIAKQALISGFPAGFRAQDLIQLGRQRFTDEVQ